MASAIEDLRCIQVDLEILSSELEEIFNKTKRVAEFLEEQIERLEDD